MTDGTADSAADTMGERAGESRQKLWLLLEADRRLLTVAATAAVFVGFVVAVATLGPPFTEQLADGDAIDTLFSGMITAIVTGATLVVTIGQLVLTQENGPLGDQHERMADSMAVRESIAAVVDGPVPTDPAAFLDALLAAAVERARSLESELDAEDAAAVDAVAELTGDVTDNATPVRERLDGATFGSFAVLSAALDFDYSWNIAAIERIRDDHGAALSVDDADRLDDLEEALSLFGPAREHVKTLYFQWALIDLSQLILYAAVPAVVVAGVMVAVVDAGTVSGSLLGVDAVVLLVGGAFAVTLVPFLLFVTYVLRILTVAKRTLAIEPLVLRE